MGAVTRPVTIARRFRGPPDSGNGGYSAGVLAAAIDGDAEVTLRRPPPLERALRIERADGATVMRDGDLVVAVAVATTVGMDPPAPVALDDAAEASRRCPTLVHPDWHPFPGCFVCGPDREPGDGLRIFAGPTSDPSVWAAPWTPAADLADDSGVVRPEFVWAALDCPSCSGIYARGTRPASPFVLGRIAVRVDALPRAGEPHVILAWRVGEDGRKTFGASALRDATGRLLAVARATWLSV